MIINKYKIKSVNQESKTNVISNKDISDQEAILKAKKTSQEHRNSISIPKHQRITEVADIRDFNSDTKKIKVKKVLFLRVKNLVLSILNYDIYKFVNVYSKYEVSKCLYDFIQLMIQ